MFPTSSLWQVKLSSMSKITPSTHKTVLLVPHNQCGEFLGYLKWKTKYNHTIKHKRGNIMDLTFKFTTKQTNPKSTDLRSILLRIKISTTTCLNEANWMLRIHVSSLVSLDSLIFVVSWANIHPIKSYYLNIS